MTDTLPLRPWEIASVAFFSYTIAAALALPRLGRPARGAVVSGALAGIVLTVISIAIPENSVLHGLFLPPALLLLAYWTSGRLFVAPMPWAERMLARIDGDLGIRAISAALPRALVELLEVAYVGVYPLIPVALILMLLFAPAPDIPRFWTVLLVTDYVCFGFLPWVQTRPPRALESAEPWISRVRALNLKLLGAASIHVNTFPSGHAAEALAAALLVASAPWPVALVMFVAAAAVSAGAVFGRYHYAADIVLGWIVALVIWLLV
jgi:membrane-associated phospholipid phosphatase